MPDHKGGDDDKDLGLDWLAAQLNADGSSKSAAESDEGDGAADARPDSAPTVALPVAPAAGPPAPRSASPAPQRSDSPASETDAAPAGDVTAPAESAPAPGGFRWGLTPTIQPDPAVDSARRTPPAKATAAEPATPTPAAAPPAAAPPVAAVTPAAAPPTAPAPAPGSPVAAVPPAAVPPAAVPPAAVPPAAVPPAAVPPAALPPVAPARPAAPAPVSDTQPSQPLTKTPAAPRRSPADLEAAPWWTTPAQSRLVPTAEEEAAAQGRRTPATPPSPLDTGAAPRTAAAASAAPAPHRAAHVATPAAEEPPAALPVSAATAAAATGAVAPSPVTDAHAAPEPTTGETGPRRSRPADGTPPRRPTKRTLYWAGGALLAVLVIIGLFFLGQNLGGPPVAAPTESASAEPSATPTPTTPPEPAASAPLAAGVYAWDAMFGTECLEPYTSPWDEEFTVVDCATPHTAQLVFRGVLEGDSGSPFPGEQAFAEQINVLCSAPGVIDFEAAGAYADVQLQGSYPVTAEQWDAGDRYYYCFASRSSGEPLTTSLAPVA